MRHVFDDPRKSPTGDKPATSVEAKLAEGDDVAITLEELGPAGYTWEVLEPSASIIVAKESVPTKNDDPGRVGGPSTVRFVLTPTKPGTATVTLVHRRPWAKDDEADRLVVTLTR